MNRLNSKIEIAKAYRNWRASESNPAPQETVAPARGKRRRSAASREKSRQAALKRWARAKRA